VEDIEGHVEFKNVSYKYPNTDQLVVKDFSLDVKPGECIAVVGSSGSGKSTLMNLIIGLLIPTEGQFMIDGKSITEFNLSQYRHHISVVPQNSILFAGTIRENITYGLSKYSEEDLNRAVEMANLNEFLSELPSGIETNIGEHGDKLSGGQKQRITIARALIRNPKILILDEATSALDNISEYQVQKAISKSIRGRTTFIVAHRLSTIRDADRIVVMEQGVAVEMGTYQELMDKKGKFYELKCLSDITAKTAEQALA
jgi:ATP-binding cassette subfamily B protein